MCSDGEGSFQGQSPGWSSAFSACDCGLSLCTGAVGQGTGSHRSLGWLKAAVVRLYQRI